MQTIHGKGTFGKVFGIGENYAVKIVRPHPQIFFADLTNETTIMQTLKKNKIPNVAEIVDELTDVDESGNVFVIGMKQYYASLFEFTNYNIDVKSFQWKSSHLIQFIVKLTVKYSSLFII